MNNARVWIITGGSLGFLAVILGAFGTHVLEQDLSAELLESYKTGILYHLLHSIIITAIALSRIENFYKAALFFSVGIILFSFSIYIYVLTEVTGFVWLTPIGGIILIIGWALVIFEGLRYNRIKK